MTVHSHNKIVSVTVDSANGKEASGLKRQLFTTTLGGVDLLYGVNGAGKTTRGPLAITVGIEGLATTAADPRRPYIDGDVSNTSLSMAVQTPAGIRHLHRDLWITRGSHPKEVAAAADELLGTPPTAWDLRDFATGTDNTRGAILDAVARAGGRLEQWDQDRAQKEVYDRLMKALADRSDDIKKDDWLNGYESAKRSLTRANSGEEWLKAAETWAVAEAATANSAQKAAKGHVEEIGDNAPSKPDSDADSLRARRDEIIRRVSGIDADAKAVAQAQAALDRYRAEGERLQSAMQAAQAEGERLKVATPAPSGFAEEIAEAQESLRKAEAQLSAPVPAYDGESAEGLQSDLDAIKASVAMKEEAKAKTQAAVEAAEGACRDAEAAQDAARAVMTEAEAAERAAVAAVEALSGLHGADGTCKSCGTSDPLGLHEKIAAAQEQATSAAAEAHAARTAFDAATSLRDERMRAWTDARTAHNAAVAALASERQAADRLTARIDAAAAAVGSHGKRVAADRQAAVDAARRTLAAAQRRQSEAQQRHEQQERQRLSDLEAARGRWLDAHKAHKAWADADAPVVPAAADNAEKAALRAELATVERDLSAHVAYEQAVAQAQEAVARYERLRAVYLGYKGLVKAVRDSRDALAAAAYKPIQDAAQGLFDGVDAGTLPLPYFNGVSDYGADVPGKGRVPYSALSESQQRITAGALVYALATVAGNPCRIVLIDGLEVVQADHAPVLVAALTEAWKAGKVDNVVLTMRTVAPGATQTLPDGTVIDLHEQEIAPFRSIDGLTLHFVEDAGGESAPVTAPAPASAEATPAPQAAPTAAGQVEVPF